MDTGGIAVAALAGAALGALAPTVAARIGDARYGEGTEGHDPEDEALAPLRSFEGVGLRVGCAVAGGGACALLASQYANGRLVAVPCGLAVVALVASLVDLRYLRLPNLLTYGGAAAALAAIAVVAASLDITRTIQGAVVGAVAYAGFLFVVAELFRVVRGRTGMGLGDVKLALSLGATLGWLGYIANVEPVLGAVTWVIYGALAGNVLGVVGGLVLTRFQPDREFPFGPFLVLGWLLVIALRP